VASRFTELIVDAADPERLAHFWMAVLDWQPTGRYQGPPGSPVVVEIGDPAREPGMAGPTITFVPVSDEKRGKNRLHIDVNPVGCDQDEEVVRLIGLGARRVDVGQGSDKTWVVLADPEGNEFCVLRARLD
jgi:hypothetical protein